MKKITFLLVLLVVFSCGKDDLTGIPPVVRGKIETPNEQIKELLADEVDVTAYKVGEKVKLKWLSTTVNHQKQWNLSTIRKYWIQFHLQKKIVATKK